MSKLRYIIFTIFVSLILCFTSSNVFALDNEYGIYCGYGDYYFIYSGSHKDNVFNLETNFDELGVLIESNRPGNSLSDTSERQWLTDNGILNQYGSFVCPIDPFGTDLGFSIDFECGSLGCNIYNIETNATMYSCDYQNSKNKKTLKIDFILNSQYNRGKWDVTYPDGSKKTYVGSEVNGESFQLMTEDCQDIYFIPSTNDIFMATTTNESVSNNNTLASLCDKYDDNQIEHYCANGTCTYQEMVCTAYSESCDGIIGQEMLDFINKIFTWIRIIAPIIVIVLGAVEFAGAAIQDDKDALKKAFNKFVKRLIIAVALFFIPLVIEVILNIFNEVTGASSSTCGIGR